MSGSKLSLLFLLVATSTMAAPTAYKQGEVIVKYKDGAVRTRAAMNELYDAVGVKSVKRFVAPISGMEHLILRDGVKTQDAIAALNRNSAVEYAQPNYVLHLLKPVHRFAGVTGDIPCIPGFDIPGCTNNGGGGGSGIPCIPGMNIPGCTNNGGGGSGIPCIPGMNIPGCTNNGGGNTPTPNPPVAQDPPPPTPPASDRPVLAAAPADVNPPVDDPQLAQAWGVAKVGAVTAWKQFRGSKDFIVADVDTGIDYNHEDLAFNIWRNPSPGDKNDIVGYDFIHDDGLPFDDNEHGTHTAGTIGAVGGNGIGVSGVVQRVSIMAVKFLDDQGSGVTTGAINAIGYAVAHGARVLNNSWGGTGDDQNNALLDAINQAAAKGVLFVAAAGNDGTSNDDVNPAVPASFTTDNMIAVAATDDSDALAFFSNYGPKTTHIAAPGTNVLSTLPGNKYGQLDGTSMACPHVTGAAALVWAAHPAWDYKQVKAAILNSVDKVAGLDGKVSTGGRLNVMNAMRSTE